MYLHHEDIFFLELVLLKFDLPATQGDPSIPWALFFQEWPVVGQFGVVIDICLMWLSNEEITPSEVISWVFVGPGGVSICGIP